MVRTSSVQSLPAVRVRASVTSCSKTADPVCYLHVAQKILPHHQAISLHKFTSILFNLWQSHIYIDSIENCSKMSRIAPGLWCCHETRRLLPALAKKCCRLFQKIQKYRPPNPDYCGGIVSLKVIPRRLTRVFRYVKATCMRSSARTLQSAPVAETGFDFV